MKFRGLLLTVIIIFLVLMLQSGIKITKAQGPTITSLGPGGGQINCLTIDPTTPLTLYAGARTKVYKSLDGGANWALFGTIVLPGDQTLVIVSMIVDPLNSNNVYAAVDDNFGEPGTFIYKSTDAGRTWNVVNTARIQAGAITFSMDPVNLNNMFLGTSANGVYTSADGGKTWIQVRTTPLSTNTVSQFAFDPTNTATIYAATSAGVFKTTNGGANWVSFSVGIPANLLLTGIVVDRANPNNLYVATLAGVYKSSNGGLNWGLSSNGLPQSDFLGAIAIDPLNPSLLYVTTGDGKVFETSNGGALWTQSLNGIGSSAVTLLVADPVNAGTVYVSGPVGVFKSTNSGNNWSGVDNGLNLLSIRSLVLDQNNSNTVYAGSFGAGAFKSVDGGTNWQAANNGLGGLFVNAFAMDPKNTSIIYAATDGGLSKTTDGGESWTSINNGFTALNAQTIAIDPSNTSIVFAGSRVMGLFKSTDAGASWIRLTQGFFQNADAILSIAIDPSSTNTIYAGTVSQGLYKSTDGGTTWILISTLNNFPVDSIAIDPHNSQIIYFIGRGSVTKTTDGGKTFTGVSAGLPTQFGSANTNCIAFDPLLSNVLYAGAGDGVYKSLNGDFTWNQIIPVQGGVSTLAIVPSAPNTIYIGTFNESVLRAVIPPDATPPSVNITAPRVGQLSNTRSIFVTGTAIDDSAGSGVISVSVNGSSATLDRTTGVFSAVVVSGSDGPFTISVTATDIAGNVSAPVTSTINIDTTAPTISITTPVAGQTLTGSITVTGTVSDTGSGVASVAVNHVLASLNGNSFTTTVANSCNGGDTILTAIATDNAGNSATTSRHVIITGSASSTACLNSSGPFGGGTFGLAIDPNHASTLYTVDSIGRIYKTVDGGANWQASNQGLPPLFFTSAQPIAVDPSNSQTIYFGTPMRGMYKSTDGGITWAAANTGIENRTVIVIAIDKASHALFAGTDRGLYKSIDQGASWQLLSNRIGIPSSVEILSLVADPINSGTLYASLSGLMVKTADGGQSWTSAGAGLGSNEISAIAIDPTNGGTLYAGGFEQLFATQNAGGTWGQVANAQTASRIQLIVVDPLHSSSIYLADQSADGVYKSVQNGSGLVQMNSGLSDLNINGIVVDPTNSSIVYAATGAGVFKSTNGGSSWAMASNGINALNVQGFSRASQTSPDIYAATDHGVAHSPNNGSTWEFLNTGLSSVDIFAVAVSPSNPQTIYAATLDGMFVSNNAGQLWTLVNNGLILKASNGVLESIPQAVVVNPFDLNTVYIGVNGDEPEASQGVFKSTNGGKAWTAVNNGLLSNSIFTLVFDPNDRTRLMAGTATGIFLTTTGGSSWSALSPQSFNSPATSIAMTASLPGTIYYAANDASVRKSVDGGLSWKTLSTGLGGTQIWSVAIDSSNNNVVYAGTNTFFSTIGAAAGVFISNNGGSNWTTLAAAVGSSSKINALLQDLAYPKTVYAATNNSGISLIQLPVDTTAPTVTVATPAANFAMAAKNIFVSGTASDSLSGVASVSVNGTTASYDIISGVFSAVVSADNEGPFVISVTATDNAGNTSSPVTVTVIIDRTPPSLTIDSPAEGSTTGSTVTVTGTVSDSGSGIFTVTVNGLRATVTGNTYSATLDNSCGRPLSITAVAFDKAFNSTIVSHNVSVNVQNTAGCWNNLGPEGGNFAAIATDPSNSSIAYASTTLGGFFKTADSGATWASSANDFLGGSIISLLPIQTNPTTIYLSGSGGVYKSIDAGSTWHPACTGFSGPTGALTGDPSNSLVLYVSTSAGVLKSSDGGNSCIPFDNGINGSVRTVAVDPINSNVLYAGTSSTSGPVSAGRMYKSTNGGNNWQNVTGSLPTAMSVDSIVIDRSNTQTLYAGTSVGIFRSMDGGITWAAVNNGLAETNVQVLLIDPTTNSTLYAGTGPNSFQFTSNKPAGLFRSTDGGNTWAPFGAGLPASIAVNALAFDKAQPPGLYAATNDGIFKSTDNGADWTPANHGAFGNRGLVTGVDPSNPNTIYTSTLAGLFKSTDGGQTWQFLTEGIQGDQAAQIAFDPFTNSVFVLSSGGLLKSLDGGLTWASLPTGGKILAFDPFHQGTMFVGSNSGLQKSTDGGVSWRPITKTPFGGAQNNFFNSTSGIVFDPTTSGKIYVANQNLITLSKDDGQSWSDIVFGNSTFFCFQSDIADPKVFYACEGTVMIKSTDGLTTLVPSGNAIPGNSSIFSIVESPDDPQVLYAISFAGKIFKSTDAAANWVEIDTGLNGFLATDGITINPGDLSTIYAGGAGGLFNLRQAQDQNELVPSITSLSQTKIIPGTAGLSLTIGGGNFVTGSKVLWNGSPRFTTFSSANQLVVSVLASDLASTGTANVTVLNPGNHVSNSQTVAIAKLDQTINFATIPDKSVNDAPFSVNATSSSGLPVKLTASGSISLSGNTVTILSTGTGTITASQDGDSTFNPAVSVSHTFNINNPFPQILRLNPGAVVAGGAQTTVKIFGGNFVAGSLVQIDGALHSASFINTTELDLQLSPAEIASAATKNVTVVNPQPGGGSTSASLNIISITSSDTKTVQVGGSDTASNAPSQAGDAGITAQLNHSQSSNSPATVTVSTYSADPLGNSGLIDVGGGYVGLKVTGASASDSLNATFYYPSTVIGADETKLKLLYFNGTQWAAVKSSGNTDPVKNMTDNQDGTVSGGTFTVIFDETSSPKLSELSGTIFSSSPGLYGDLNGDLQITVSDLVLLANAIAGNLTIDTQAGDLNQDGVVTISDLVTLANFLAGNIGHLPVSSGQPNLDTRANLGFAQSNDK